MGAAILLFIANGWKPTVSIYEQNLSTGHLFSKVWVKQTTAFKEFLIILMKHFWLIYCRINLQIILFSNMIYKRKKTVKITYYKMNLIKRYKFNIWCFGLFANVFDPLCVYTHVVSDTILKSVFKFKSIYQWEEHNLIVLIR